jgi:ACS family hexuronate transporter-like MFS transporter
MFWIPKYLSDARGMELDSIGYVTWIPFLALGVANMLGGWFSDIALRKSGNVNFARKLVMGVGAALTVPVAFVSVIPSTGMIVVVMSLAFFAHGLWITNYITSIGDVFGKTSTSTIVGLSGTAGAISSLIVNPLTGYIIACSYTPLWIYAGVMYPVAFLIFLAFLPQLKLRNEKIYV